ncbi:MAG: hypothetical protein J5580_00035 [Clostridia bacterium]|nr:hypothetical protein [Clostridia bacterium]
MAKLTTFTINEKDRLIKIISENSSKYGDKLIQFMELNHLNGLRNATVPQLQNFVAKCALEKQIEEKIF